MKTWTNPTVEELDVKLTANGFFSTEIEQLIPGLDLPIIGKDDPVTPPEPEQPVVPDPEPGPGDGEKDEETYPS